ncbi:MAG: periplasmic copper chaperone [Sphingomonadales bacterium]|jgi:copper(I)-binding protein|nr:periplasmic copper chaperone [Sphingomonadales bacterium]
MRKMHKIHSAAVFGALFLLLAGCGERRPDGIAVSKAWVRLPAVKGEAGAGYFTIEGGAEGTRLTGVSSPMASRVELHESMEQGGMSAMRPLKNVEFDYRRRIDFAPGGKHAMLFGINSAVKPGAVIPLTFAFDTAPPVTVDAEVRDAAGESH